MSTDHSFEQKLNELERKLALQNHLKMNGINFGHGRHGASSRRYSRLSQGISTTYAPSINLSRDTNNGSQGQHHISSMKRLTTRTSVRQQEAEQQTLRKNVAENKTIAALPLGTQYPALKFSLAAGSPITLPLRESNDTVLSRLNLDAISRTVVAFSDIHGLMYYPQYSALVSAVWWLMHVLVFENEDDWKKETAPPAIPAVGEEPDLFQQHLDISEYPKYDDNIRLSSVSWLRDVVATSYVSLHRRLEPRVKDRLTDMLPYLVTESVVESIHSLWPRAAQIDCPLPFANMLRCEVVFSMTGIEHPPDTVAAKAARLFAPMVLKATEEIVDEPLYHAFELFPRQFKPTTRAFVAPRNMYKIPELPSMPEETKQTPVQVNKKKDPANTSVAQMKAAAGLADEMTDAMRARLLSKAVGAFQDAAITKPSYLVAKEEASFENRVKERESDELTVRLYKSKIVVPKSRAVDRPIKQNRLDMYSLSPIVTTYQRLMKEKQAHAWILSVTQAEQAKEDELARALKQSTFRASSGRTPLRSSMAVGSLTPLDLPAVYGYIAQDCTHQAARSKSVCAGEIRHLERQQEKHSKAVRRQQALSKKLVDERKRIELDRLAVLGDGLEEGTSTSVHIQRARTSLQHRMDVSERAAEERANAARPGLLPVSELAKQLGHEPLGIAGRGSFTSQGTRRARRGREQQRVTMAESAVADRRAFSEMAVRCPLKAIVPESVSPSRAARRTMESVLSPSLKGQYD
ncbi:hypothetical protein J8273_3618 [Carpediemonas membranifera]|uniref:Uncharacterized protein n=1 Tax=Carpediemonas membranifera TaxID=201153 RepID=A0A8J6AT72_9EUKA|nr:hypothetical protein J8273_3618 [Carpediemonas membranifera]|eukprot:KAG9393478.1 hypothetical protein J8273_3618 [Carpediemonas membranifera]